MTVFRVNSGLFGVVKLFEGGGLIDANDGAEPGDGVSYVASRGLGGGDSTIAG